MPETSARPQWAASGVTWANRSLMVAVSSQNLLLFVSIFCLGSRNQNRSFQKVNFSCCWWKVNPNSCGIFASLNRICSFLSEIHLWNLLPEKNWDFLNELSHFDIFRYLWRIRAAFFPLWKKFAVDWIILGPCTHWVWSHLESYSWGKPALFLD